MSQEREEVAIVERLGEEQLEKLAAHRDRRHWWNTPRRFLLDRLREEVDELEAALMAGEDPWQEAADVANFAAMLADQSEPAVPR